MPTIDANGRTLQYFELGHGPAVVLLHAFPLDGRVWQTVAEKLSSRGRVIVPDLRGFGRNPPEEAFTIDDLAADVAGVMEMLGVAPCPVAGLSMGGYVAMALAKNYPGIATRLFLVDTKAAADGDEARANRDAVADVALTQGSIAVAQQLLPFMTAPNSDAKLVSTLRTIMDGQPPRTVAAASRAMRDRADFTDFLPTLDVPVDVIVGEHDALTPPDAAQETVSQLQRGTITVIPNAGHLSPVEQPQAVADAIAKGL